MNEYVININSFSANSSLLDAMAAVNLPWTEESDPPFNGEFFSFRDPESSSKPPSNKAAWFKGEILPGSGIKVAVFGSHRCPDSGPWNWSSAPLSPQSQEELERIRKEAEAERQRRHEAAAIAANVEWESAIVVAGNEHPYLQRKGVSSHGILRIKGDILVVPQRDIDGNLYTITRIWPDGTKRNFPDGDPKGHFCTIGPQPDKTIFIATGIATALTVYSGNSQ